MGIGAMAAAASIGAAVLMGQASAAKAAEIAVFATASLRQALEKLGPQFERASGHKLTYQLGTSAPLKRQIDAGAAFDLAILVPASLDALIKDGKVLEIVNFVPGSCDMHDVCVWNGQLYGVDAGEHPGRPIEAKYARPGFPELNSPSGGYVFKIDLI